MAKSPKTPQERGAEALDREARRVKGKPVLRIIDPDTEVTPESCGIPRAEQWKFDLIQDCNEKTGKVSTPCRVHNLLLILENTPEWQGRLQFNEFRQWITQQGQEFIDADEIELKAWLEKEWIDGEVKTSVVREAVLAVAYRHSHHPPREKLEALVWDGEERIPTFFTDFCGTPFSPYSEAVARSFFVSAVARILRPGCKVDTMVVLEGEQGIGKSQLVQALFGSLWHCDITQAPNNLDFYQNLRGKWIGEFSDLGALGRVDQNVIKQALTITHDTYRASYGRNARSYPRQYIFVGNTNKTEYLTDETGARRYLPIACHEINAEGVMPIRSQLWAEAVHRYRAGEKWHNIPNAKAEQDLRYMADSWEDYIAPWLGRQAQSMSPRVTISDVLEFALQIRVERHDRSAQTRVGAILHRLGWRKRQESSGKRQRFYVPPAERQTRS